MTGPPSGLAGTAHAYRSCAWCGHAWIRHTFASVPACSHMVYAGTVQPDGTGTGGYSKCICPGWQEPGTPDAGGQNDMTTPDQRPPANVHEAAEDAAVDAQTCVVEAGKVAAAGDHYEAARLYGAAVHALEGAAESARAAMHDALARAGHHVAGKDTE